MSTSHPRRLRRSATVLSVLVLVFVLVATSVPAQSSSGLEFSDAATRHAAAVQDWRGDAGADAYVQAGAPRPAEDVAPGSLLVTLRDRQSGLQSFDAWGFGGAVEVATGVFKVDVDPAQVDAASQALRVRAEVLAVEPNRIRRFHAVPDDPLYPQQWAHQLTRIESAWDTSTGSDDVVVAVADSGIVASHPDLAGIDQQVDASSGEIRAGARDNDPCKIGHGTRVAGVLAATGDNATGIAGVNWRLSVLDINTADPDVTCAGPTDAGLIAAISFAAQQDADVVNLSLGGAAVRCPTAMQAAIDSAIAAGTAVIASAGNGGTGSAQVPASCNGVMSVGAVTADGQVAGYSGQNPYVDLVAPGGGDTETRGPETDILTTSYYSSGDRTEEYLAIAGTSYAAPYVSGVAALMRAVAPSLSPAQIESLLESTATDLGQAGRDEASGWGLVQGAAVTRAAAGGTVSAPQADPEFPVGGTGMPRPGGDVSTFRLAAGTRTTEPISQAVAASRAVFADSGRTSQTRPTSAKWAVIARDDDYADGLAGSSLTLGAAPLLFTTKTGRLASATGSELTRVLAPGSTVYLLGGSAALPSTLDAEITALGFRPVRLAGPVRESTAVKIADEVDRLLVEVLGLSPSPVVILVNRDNWPDAVAAGALGARFGYPILLTPPDDLARQTSIALSSRDIEELIVVGGTVRVSEATTFRALTQARVRSSTRLAGEERNGTVVAVSDAVEALVATTPQVRPAWALAVNVRRDDAYAHMVSSTVPLAVMNGVFIPVDDGDTPIAPVARNYATGLGVPTLLVGKEDVITTETGAALERIVETVP